MVEIHEILADAKVSDCFSCEIDVARQRQAAAGFSNGQIFAQLLTELILVDTLP